MSNNKKFIWQSEVRDYELDFQGVVNNAIYLHYLDQARAKFFNEIGIDLKVCTDKQINIVLIKTEISFIRSLTFAEEFVVHTMVSRVSRLKLLFDQQIVSNKTNQLILKSNNLVCCVDTKSGKPCRLDVLQNLNDFLNS
jgi:acyl-CoA thioester hydrolase